MGSLKILVMIFLIFIGGPVISYFASPTVRHGVHFSLWHFGLRQVPDISRAISSAADNVVTVQFQSPTADVTEELLLLIEEAKNYESSVFQLENKRESEFEKLKIDAPKRKIAALEMQQKEKYWEQIKTYLNKNRTGGAIGIGINSEELNQVNLLKLNYKEDLVKLIKVQGMMDLGKRLRLPLSIYFVKDPKPEIQKYFELMEMKPEVKLVVSKFIEDAEIKADYSYGLPVYKISHAKVPNLVLRLTLLGKRFVVWSTNQDAFRETIHNLTKDNLFANSESVPEDQIFRTHFNFESLLNLTPVLIKNMAPPIVKNLSQAEISVQLADSYQIKSKISFSDPGTAKQAFAQAKMYKMLLPTMIAASSNQLQIQLLSSLKMDQKESDIDLSFEIKFAEIKKAVLALLKTQWQTAESDNRVLQTVSKYMLTNNLVKINFMSDQFTNIEAQMNLLQNGQWHVLQQLILKTLPQAKKFRPLMLVAQLSCQETAAVDLKLFALNDKSPLMAYPLFKNPQFSQEVLGISSKTPGIQVMVFQNSKVIDHLSLDVLPNYSEAMQRMLIATPSKKRSPSSTCQVGFSPFILAQEIN